MSIRWGILSTGNIARLFAVSFRQTEGGVLQGVASRSEENARTFAETYGVKRAYPDYRHLIEADDIDVVYIGTPHTHHFHDAAKCLQNGKHVLCEKPVTMNAEQLEVLINLAKETGCFFMEAVWSRFLPVYQHINRWMEQEMDSRVEYLRADFGIYKEFDPESRIFNPELGGGSLLDLGFYPVWLALHAYNSEPKTIHAEGRLLENGTDDLVTMTLNFPDGGKADLMCANRMATPTKAEIYGNGYRLEIDTEFHCPYRASLTRGDHISTYNCKFKPHGYQFETDEVNRCIRDGLQESPAIPLESSRQIMRTLDRIREQIGLNYPEKCLSTSIID